MIIIVILLFLLVSFFSFFKLGKKTTQIFFVLIGVILFLIAGFRGEGIDRDYSTYLLYYNKPGRIAVELSFTIISTIAHFFGDPIFLFVFYATLGVVLKVIAIRELTALCFLSSVIYISNLYILHELTQIRAGVASGFLLLCIKPIYDRNFWKFIIFAGCATLFHYSAILVFLLWFIKGNHINKYFYATIIPLAYIVHFLNINLMEMFIKLIPITDIQKKYSVYMLLQEQEFGDFAKINVFNLSFLASCLIYYVILWKSELVKMQNRYVNLLLKIEAFSLTSFILFSAMPVFAFRISELLGVVEIILIPFMYYAFKPKLLSTSIVVSAGLGLLLINLFYIKLIT